MGYQYTDVTLCSEDRRFGKTDLGAAGFEGFFSTHKCNELCARMGLTHVAPEAAEAGSALRRTATSAIEIIRSRHLRERKRQRGVDTIEMQAAVKHGAKEAGHVPGTVKHIHNGVAVVTTDVGRHLVGITAFPTVKSRPIPLEAVNVDETLVCRDCKSEFAFSAGEQRFFKAKGWANKPIRCGQCREAKRPKLMDIANKPSSD